MRQGDRLAVRRRAHALVSVALALVLGCVLATTASPVTAAAETAPAETSSASASTTTDATAFRAGYIISDDQFFNYQSMTLSGVQHFLASVDCVPRDHSACLSDYRAPSKTVPASPGRCSHYTGRASESAASIVWRVAQACRINPQVLLVLMQKEQSLLTHPSATGYQKATGYACPDTAACDAKYYGLFNQVYAAAWQFREYTLHPKQWRYRIGESRIAYHPDHACGSSLVDIRNQATADLYNYTPYQPNAETIADPGSPAGACSSYGNLNFSRLFRHWFGDPLSVTFPGWAPACLNYVGGRDCLPADAFDPMPRAAYTGN